jgi:D-3-phosphoglycerate dehydrogenase
VAEIVIAHIVNLARRTFDVSSALHQGNWNKAASGCFEIRGKTIGIVGYGEYFPVPSKKSKKKIEVLMNQ